MILSVLHEIREKEKLTEAIARGVPQKKVFLQILQNSKESTCARACNFIKIEALAKIFSYEFCEFLGTFFFYRTSPVDASV